MRVGFLAIDERLQAVLALQIADAVSPPSERRFAHSAFTTCLHDPAPVRKSIRDCSGHALGSWCKPDKRPSRYLS